MVGYPFNQIPPEAFINGAAGYGRATLCGSLGVAAACIGMVTDADTQRELVGELFDWYKEFPFPEYQPEGLLLVTSLPLVKNIISLNEFKRLPLIFREEGSGTRQTIRKALLALSISIEDLNIIYELNSMEAIKTSVLSGKGISFIPELSIKRELRDGDLREIKVEGLDIFSEFFIACRKDHDLTDYEKNFIQFIKSSRRGFC